MKMRRITSKTRVYVTVKMQWILKLKSEAYDNCWDKELNCNNKSQNYETIDAGSVAEQTVSEEITEVSSYRSS